MGPIQGITTIYKQFMDTHRCQSMCPVNVLSTPTCLFVYPINDMGTHQHRLRAQLKTETLLLISKHELLLIHE